jgi:CrcB protein
MTVVLIAIAGALGVLSRYGLSSTVHGDALPWMTVAINVIGSFALGLIVVLPFDSEEVRSALGVGFLGGFTTFSTFSVQAVLDADAGEPGRAALYVGASVVLGIAAATAGYALGHALRS